MSVQIETRPLTFARREPLPAVDLVIAGATGRVGTALRQQIDAARKSIAYEHGVDIRYLLLANSRVTTWIDEREDESAATDWPSILSRLEIAHAERRLLFVDCTASRYVASLYAKLLDRGIGVVTPNKIGIVGDNDAFESLRDKARLRRVPLKYETTVGAALPVLSSIDALVTSGDAIHSVSAVLSGTISFVLRQLHDGVRFSDAVADAIGRGFTEPDPRIDLSGEDVARKLVILGRSAGWRLDREDVSVESLVSDVMFDGDVDAFVDALRRDDRRWRDRVEAALADGNRLAYVASVREGVANVGIGAIAASHPLAAARPAENVVIVKSSRYSDTPLTISGPGAGPEVTASGVLADIVSAAQVIA